MTKEEIMFFGLILILNVLSSSFANLKTIFMSKQAGKITYIVTFIDATMYSLVLKSFNSTGYLSIVAYVLGKLIGIYLADKIEKKLAIGLVDITLYVGNKEKMNLVQSVLLENDFSSTVRVGYMAKDVKRYEINIQLARKNMGQLLELLENCGIDNPTMVVQEIKKVSGKIKHRVS